MNILFSKGQKEKMWINANGIRMNYELSGRKSAPVVILSHSLGSSLVMWNSQMDTLNTFFQVLRYDIRGHGATDAPEGPYTLEMLGDDVIGLLNALNIDKMNFVGLSMGGMIGQMLALNHPERLTSLILCDTIAVIPPDTQPTWQERILKAKTTGMGALLKETMERWFTPSFLAGKTQASGMLPVIQEQYLKTPVSGFIGCAEAIRAFNTLPRLSEIKTPTLIIVGEDDPGPTLSVSENMHRRISGSKLIVLPSARHLSNVEQPEAFNEALIEFLRNI